MADITTDLLTVAEVADRLRLHPVTVRRWIREGALPAVRVGATYRITTETVDALLAAS